MDKIIQAPRNTTSTRYVVTTTHGDGTSEATWHSDRDAALRHMITLTEWLDGDLAAKWGVLPYASVTFSHATVTDLDV